MCALTFHYTIAMFTRLIVSIELGGPKFSQALYLYLSLVFFPSLCLLQKKYKYYHQNKVCKVSQVFLNIFIAICRSFKFLSITLPYVRTFKWSHSLSLHPPFFPFFFSFIPLPLFLCSLLCARRDQVLVNFHHHPFFLSFLLSLYVHYWMKQELRKNKIIAIVTCIWAFKLVTIIHHKKRKQGFF
jgi:hypothetical protein